METPKVLQLSWICTALYSLEKLIEWKLGMNSQGSSLDFSPLYSLEKLIEWKQVLNQAAYGKIDGQLSTR